MSKYFFWLFILVLFLVAGVNVYLSLGKEVHTTTLWKILKFSLPSYENQGKFFVELGTGEGNVGKSGIKSSVGSETSKSLGGQDSFQTKKPTPPPGFSENQLSPYYGMIKIGYINPGFYGMGKIEIYATWDLPKPVNITGWKLQSNRKYYSNLYNDYLIIPSGVDDYKMRIYDVKESGIYLEKGGKLNIFNWVSGNGKNFRLNKCSGYLNSEFKFKPELPCRYVKMYDRVEIETFTGKCQNFVLSLPSCYTPTPQELSQFYNDPQCRYFLDRFNYEGCYTRFRQDTDFFSNEWYAWVPGFWNFDRDHDRILLLDQNGLLVDIYSY